jgi:predicted dehydrogenase
MNRTDKTIRLATVGAFGHWVFVLDEIAGIPQLELVAAASALPGEPLATVLAHRATPKNVATFDDHRAMLKAVRPDVVVLSCRLDRVPHLAMEIAEAGCDLICEKPLALDLATLDKLHRTIRATGVRLMAMLSMRADPVFQTARRLYRSGAIGNAALVNARKSYKYGHRPDWFGARATYGGTMPWVGIHALDMIRFITGQTFCSVMARQKNFAHPERPDCEDSVAAVFELANGGSATVSVDLLRPSAAATHGDDWIRVVGTRGVIEARSNDGVVQLLTESSGPQTIQPDPPRPIYRPFLLRQDSEDELMQPEDAFLLTQACLCARDAADAGQAMPIVRQYNNGGAA